MLQAADRDSQRLVVALDDNPVDEVWGSQRPPQPSSDVYVHPKEYRGEHCLSQQRISEKTQEESDSLSVPHVRKGISHAHDFKSAAFASSACMQMDLVAAR